MKLFRLIAGVLCAIISAVIISACSQSSTSPTPPLAQDQTIQQDQTGGVMQPQEEQQSETPLSTVQQLVANAAFTPPPAVPRMASTWGRIGVGHVFDSGITTTEIASLPNHFDVIWGSFSPNPWRSADPSALVSRYYILEEDAENISKHTLSWWQANHPSWILYACTPSGAGTKQIAYTPGVGFPDVPLDIHNPSVINYQVRQSLAPYAIAHNYNALAIDEVLLYNVMLGGNPKLGQHVISGYFGCGIWQGSTFVKRYSSKTDPRWAADVLNWMHTAHTILTTDPTIAPHHLALIANHPAASLSANELNLLANVDVVQNETGFTDYGNYTQAIHNGLFNATVNYMRYAQQHRVGLVTIQKFVQSGALTASQKEYAIGSYLMGSEQGSDLDITLSTYSSQPLYSEYNAKIGAPCGEMTNGGSTAPQIWMRRYANALVVLNSGSLPRTSEVAHLPTGHTYHDIDGRAWTNPLTVHSSDAYILLTTNGCN
jgi:hypothetical protein